MKRSIKYAKSLSFICAAVFFCIILYLALRLDIPWLAIPLTIALGWMLFQGINLSSCTLPENPKKEEDIVEGQEKGFQDERDDLCLQLCLRSKLSFEEERYIEEESGLTDYNTYLPLLFSPSLDTEVHSMVDDLPTEEASLHLSKMKGAVEIAIRPHTTGVYYCAFSCPMGLCVLLLKQTANVEEQNRWLEETGELATRTIELLNSGSDNLYVSAIGTPEKDWAYIHYSYDRACGLLQRTQYKANLNGPLYSKEADRRRDMMSNRIVQADRKFYRTILSFDMVASMECLLQQVEMEYEELSYSTEILQGFAKEKFNAMMRVSGFGELDSFGLRPDFWRRSIKSINKAVTIADLYAAIESITLEIKRDYSNSHVGDVGYSEDEASAMAEYVAYIQQHYREPGFNAQSVCEHFQISSSVLSRMFKKELGQGVLEYIHTARIRDAKEKLESEISIDEVFPQCGFYTRRAFDSVFKRYIGVSPSAYRASILKEKSKV